MNIKNLKYYCAIILHYQKGKMRHWSTLEKHQISTLDHACLAYARC
jgi:hypothetical protein